MDKPPPPPPLPGTTRAEPQPARHVTAMREMSTSNSGVNRRRFAAQTRGRNSTANHAPVLREPEPFGRERLDVICATPVCTVVEIVYVPPSIEVAGVTVQMLFAGAPLQASETAPESPCSDVSRSGKVAVVPLETVTLPAPFVVRL